MEEGWKDEEKVDEKGKRRNERGKEEVEVRRNYWG